MRYLKVPSLLQEWSRPVHQKRYVGLFTNSWSQKGMILVDMASLDNMHESLGSNKEMPQSFLKYHPAAKRIQMFQHRYVRGLNSLLTPDLVTVRSVLDNEKRMYKSRSEAANHRVCWESFKWLRVESLATGTFSCHFYRTKCIAKFKSRCRSKAAAAKLHICKCEQLYQTSFHKSNICQKPFARTVWIPKVAEQLVWKKKEPTKLHFQTPYLNPKKAHSYLS